MMVSNVGHYWIANHM